MRMILSPSKTLDMTPVDVSTCSQPGFLDRSAQLVEVLRGFSLDQIMELMAVSRTLGELTVRRFADWRQPFSPASAKPALFAFSGAAYAGLQADTLRESDVEFASEHLRLLSGLYGMLRPLDLIMPYRLEMGCPLSVGASRNLYAFWRETLTGELNDSGASVLLNLASQEYFKVIDQNQLRLRVISPVFKDEKNGQLKVISSYAKKARGLMARFVLQNRLKTADSLRGFSASGYAYDSALSTEAAPVFVRRERSVR